MIGTNQTDPADMANSNPSANLSTTRSRSHAWPTGGGVEPSNVCFLAQLESGLGLVGPSNACFLWRPGSDSSGEWRNWTVECLLSMAP